MRERKSDTKAMLEDMMVNVKPSKAIKKKLSNNRMRFDFETRNLFCCQHVIFNEGKKGKQLRSQHVSCLPRQNRDFKAFRCVHCNGVKEVSC